MGHLPAPRGPPAAAVAFAAVLIAAGLSGCFSGPPDDEAAPEPRVPLWTDPFPFPVHFDGDRAYRDLLAQIYEDPDAKEGPRYRIPGTATHAAVAGELFEKLKDPMDKIDGTVLIHNFTGTQYYALDLEPVRPWTCEAAPEDRERVTELDFMNVVARTNATHHGFIIGAHWDSKRHVTPDRDPDHLHEPVLGADDGASGTAAVIELARAFAKTPVDIPLTFILFDGEDGFEDCHPLAGSLHYAQSLSEEELETIDAMILLDMVGNVTAKYHWEAHSFCYPYPNCETDSRWLLEHVWSTAGRMGVEAFVNGSTGRVFDDHVPFLHEGVYAIDIINYGPHNPRTFPPYWHTVRDDHTAVQPEGIEQVGVVVEAALRLFDQDPSLIRPAD